MTHTDCIGNALNEGDIVLMAGAGSHGKVSGLVERMVTGFTPKMIRLDKIDPAKRSPNGWSSDLRYSKALVKKTDTQSNLEYEYAVGNIDLEEPWLDDMTYEEAQNWINTFADELGINVRKQYYIIRRPTGDWEKV